MAKKADVTISVHVDEQYRTGFVVRTLRSKDGREILHALSRKTGRWIKVTAEQIKENDIPRDCLFMVDELPESSQKGRL